jgi:hypothetical protein
MTSRMKYGQWAPITSPADTSRAEPRQRGGRVAARRVAARHAQHLYDRSHQPENGRYRLGTRSTASTVPVRPSRLSGRKHFTQDIQHTLRRRVVQYTETPREANPVDRAQLIEHDVPLRATESDQHT